MTVDQAKAALKLAPCDDHYSAVEPNMERRTVVQLAKMALAKLPPSTIDVTPAMAHKVASIVQDFPDPVPLYFSYDNAWGGPNAGSMVISVGWNKEELRVRKEIPKHVPKRAVKFSFDDLVNGDGTGKAMGLGRQSS